MRDAAERIVGDGNSAVLLELARRVGNASASESRTDSMNVVGVTMLNKPMPSQEVSVECLLRVNDDNDLFEEDERIDAIRVKNEVGNDSNIVEWNLELYPRLKELVVGDDCVWYVKGLKVSGFKSLVRVVIGSGCFCESEGCFEMSECARLRSVVIGGGCCVKWSSFVMSDCGVEEVSIGDGCFVSCEKSVFESLSSLAG